MYTTPQAYFPATLKQRCCVTFYYEGKRYRFYNGNALGIRCNPNQFNDLPSRERELRRLLTEVFSALKAGWNPTAPLSRQVVPGLCVSKVPASVYINQIRTTFGSQGWSKPYLRDMERITNELLTYLQQHTSLDKPLEELSPALLGTFLNAYRSSGTYYMNKRRNLSALFSRLVAGELLPTNPVDKTPTMKKKEVLNEAFTPEQLTHVLYHLRQHHANLHLCALLVYGTLLRPHREIRLLRRGDFNEDMTMITLSGKATKSGRIRKVPVPDFVRQVLLERGVQHYSLSAYIFTGTNHPVNSDYFTTAWSRQKQLMLKAKKILPAQTLYSFRHSAAIYSFTTKQDLRLLQSLLGHSTPDVSLKYLRSLGLAEASSPDDMPKLPKF